MSIIDLFFRRLRQRPGRAEVDLAALRAGLTDGAARLAGKEVEMDLVRAQGADHCRDLGLVPALPEDFDRRTQTLDAEGRRRLALLVGALELHVLRGVLKGLYAGQEGGQLVEALVEVVEGTPLLTLDLLRQSAFRIEELARLLLVRLGAAVQGEDHNQSRLRLLRLDYARLLAEAEKAKVSAEERMEYLRKLQEEQEARRPRRGKW
jgi:hypothetical protein